MTDFLGGESVAGVKLKENGITHWNSPNTGANNESGFAALPGGKRDGIGEFLNTADYAYYWSSTEYSSGGAWRRHLYYNNSGVNRFYSYKGMGFSVRCLRDSSQFGYLTISDKNFEAVTILNFYGDNIPEEIILINSNTEKTIDISCFGYSNGSATVTRFTGDLTL